MPARNDAKNPVPPYRRISAELRRAILAGELRPGDQLPSERTIMQQYDTARATARMAIRVLVNEGLVTAEHGRGVFVRSERKYVRVGSQRYSRTMRAEMGVSPFRAEVMRIGRMPDTECRSITRVKPPDYVADRLGVDPSKKSVVRRENWYFVDGEPVQVGETFIAVELAAGTELASAKKFSRGSIYGCFAGLGHEIMRVREEISTRIPSADERASLQLPEGVALLDVVHTGINQDGKAFEVTHFLIRGDSIVLDYNMPVED